MEQIQREEKVHGGIHVSKIIADMVARHYIRNTKGHGSSYACEFCLHKAHKRVKKDKTKKGKKGKRRGGMHWHEDGILDAERRTHQGMVDAIR